MWPHVECSCNENVKYDTIGVKGRSKIRTWPIQIAHSPIRSQPLAGNSELSVVFYGLVDISRKKNNLNYGQFRCGVIAPPLPPQPYYIAK